MNANTNPPDDNGYPTPDNGFGFERRLHSRVAVVASVYLVYKTDDPSKRVKIKRFDSINISRHGVMIDSGKYPFTRSQKVDLVLMVPTVSNVIRMYYMDAHVMHTGNGKTGFAMSKKGPKN